MSLERLTRAQGDAICRDVLRVLGAVADELGNTLPLASAEVFVPFYNETMTEARRQSAIVCPTCDAEFGTEQGLAMHRSKMRHRTAS